MRFLLTLLLAELIVTVGYAETMPLLGVLPSVQANYSQPVAQEPSVQAPTIMDAIFANVTSDLLIVSSFKRHVTTFAPTITKPIVKVGSYQGQPIWLKGNLVGLGSEHLAGGGAASIDVPLLGPFELGLGWMPNGFGVSGTLKILTLLK
jgi:hypothetical protein